MYGRKRIVGSAGRAVAISFGAIIFATVLSGSAFAAQHAAKAAPAAGEAAATSPEVAAFIALLGDPKVQKWLEQQHAAEASHEPAPDAETSSVSDYFDSRVRATREHITALGSALPDLPNQFERGVGLLQAEIPRRRTVLFLVLVFAGLGLGVEWLFRKATQKTRQRLDGLPMETVNDRLRLVAARFAFAFGVVAAFAIGSIGPFLALDWPPLLSKMVLGYLVALLATRIAVVVGHFLLAPEAERFRIIPTHTVAARFWCRRLAVFVGWFAFLSHRRPAEYSWLLDGRAPARRLRAWPRSPRHCTGIGLAPAGRAGPGRRSAVRKDASPGPRRAERATVSRYRAVVG